MAAALRNNSSSWPEPRIRLQEQEARLGTPACAFPGLAMPEHSEAKISLALRTTDLLDRDTFSQTFTNPVFFLVQGRKKRGGGRQSFLSSSLKKSKTSRMCHHNLSPSCLANLSGHIQHPSIDTHSFIYFEISENYKSHLPGLSPEPLMASNSLPASNALVKEKAQRDSPPVLSTHVRSPLRASNPTS